jgi:hypothetical protein
MQEKRLWFLATADIYYSAALVNIELANFDTALQLVEMASQEGGDEDKLQLLKKRITRLMESQP